MNDKVRLARTGNTVMASLLVLCAVTVVATTLLVLRIAHWHGPFRDMWEIYPFLQKIMAGSWTLSDLWESYGYSHRLVIPRLLFIADHRCCDASNHLLISVSVLCQAVICMLFAKMFWCESVLSRAEKSALVSVVVTLQFSATLLFNFMHTFDVQWFVCCACVTAVFFLLARLPHCPQQPGDKTAWLVLSVAGCLVVFACLDNFSGMVAWPIWFVFCWKYAGRIANKVVLSVVATVFVLCYVQGEHGAGFGELARVGVAKLLVYLLVVFPATYLVSPLAEKDFLPFGNVMLLLLLPALLVLSRFWWRFLCGKLTVKPAVPEFFLACVGLFGVGVALVTALGRGYDPSNAHASRYQNIVMLFWSAMIPLLWLQARELAPVAWRITLRLVGGVAFASYLGCQWTAWNQDMHLGFQVNRAHLALMLGYSHEIPMIAPTVSRSMIYVPGYNLGRERLLYAQAQQGIFHGLLAARWHDGVELSRISRTCGDVHWTSALYHGPYAQYEAFSVTGATRGADAAVLTDADGKVIAAAIPSEADTLATTFAEDFGLGNPVLRGFRTSDRPGYALVLLSGQRMETACKKMIAS